MRKIIAILLSALFLLSGCGEEEKTAVPPVVDISKAEYSYEEMEEDLFLLQKQYPTWLSVYSAGRSLDGRELWCARFGETDAQRQILIHGGIHGREYMTPQLLMKQLEYYLSHYETRGADGTSFADRMKGVAFYLVPMTNPDGVAISQQGIGAIRSEELRQSILSAYENDKRLGGYDQHYSSLEEYLVKWKANARGVDLNRNFGIDAWSSVKTGVTYPSSQKYKGEAPNSEPETRALIELTKSLSGLVCTVSLHSQGEILYWDCGQKDEIRDRTLQLVGAIQAVNGYRAQSEFTHPDASYNDWCVLNLGIPSVNIETGTGTCPLPIEQFSTVYDQNLALWDALLNLYRP